MQITSFDLVPYALPLTAPVTWGGETHDARRGVLVRLGDADGRVGWGDVAPLPGFSPETLAQASDAVGPAGRALVGRALEPRDLVSAGPFHDALDEAGLPSSARFGLDLALADLASQEMGRTLPQGLHPDPPVVLPLNGLVQSGDAVAQARALAEAGYPAVKLKVGRQAVAQDIETVRAVRQALPASVALRLDANRAWTWSLAVAFAQGLDGVALDYVEEPLAEAGRLAEFWHDTGLPVAVDESVQEGAEIRGWAAAAVLKPTLVGGLVATLRRAAEAEAVGVRAVVSASFESGVGLRGVAALAAATGAEPAGLDTYRWLAADVTGPLPFDRPHVDVPGLFGRPLEVRVP